MSPALVLVRRLVHVAARVDRTLAPARRHPLRDFALAEFWATTDFLYDPAEKLYFRDSRFFERRDDQGRKLFWSRGNGWVFAGIANMLDALPKDDPDRPRLESAVPRDGGEAAGAAEARRLLATFVVGPENSPPETSGTGFYVYGLAWGVNHGLLDAPGIRPPIDKGWAALDTRRGEGRQARLGATGQRPAREGRRNGHAVLWRWRLPDGGECRRGDRPLTKHGVIIGAPYCLAPLAGADQYPSEVPP